MKTSVFLSLILIFSLFIGSLAFSTSVFTVVGTVIDVDGTLAASGLEVIVNNETRKLTATTTVGKQEAAKYGVVFVNTENKSVAAEGDVLKITVKDDAQVLANLTYHLTAKDIAEAAAIVDIQFKPLTPVNQPSVFTVAGTVRNADGTLAASGLEVIVSNETRKLSATATLGKQEAGKYSVTFIDTQNKAVAAEGDILKITVEDTKQTLASLTYHLTATDIARAMAIVDIKLGAVIPSNQPPVASFSFSPKTPAENTEITFDASASYDPDGKIVSYEWDFGDGSVGKGQMVKHSYRAKGQYSVTLKVEDNSGQTNTVSSQITVGPIPEPKLKFSVGSNVKVINTGDVGLRIHEGAPTGETVKVVPDGWSLRITGGPQYNIEGHNWWEVQEEKYEPSAVKGWVAEDFLEKVSTGNIVPSLSPSYFASGQGRVEEAIKWAEAQIGKKDWEGWCLKFVKEAFKGESIEGWTSAEAARQLLERQGKFYSSIGSYNPPRGALIFFSALDEYKPYGHVGIYMGDQGIVHSYDKVRIDKKENDRSKGIVTVQSLTKIDSYLGWAYPPEKWFEVPVPPTAKDYVRSFIQREEKDKVTVTVDGKKYTIVTLGKNVDPDMLVEYVTAEKVKVYVDAEGNPVSDQQIARKIGIIDYMRQRQKDGLEKEVNDDFAALNAEMRNIGQMPLVEWVIETSKTVASAPLKVKEAIAGKVFTEIAKIAGKELVSLPGKMTKEQLADKTEEFLQEGMNRYDKTRRSLIQNKEIADYDTALSILENYLWGEAYSEIASFLAHKVYYEKYVNAWNFCISELKMAITLGLSEVTSATMISLDASIKWEHKKADVDYQLHGKSYEATEYTLKLAAVPYTPISEYEEKIARVEKIITEIGKLLIGFLDKVSFLKYFLGVILHSPGEVQVYDSQGRVTGLVNGVIKEEILDSLYDDEQKAVVIFFPSDSYRYDVVGKGEGEYGLDVTLGKDGAVNTFTAIDIPTSSGATHRYVIDWQTLSKGEKGVTVKMDTDGDGTFEQTIITESKFTYAATGVTPNDRYPTTWGNLKRTVLLQNYPNPFNPDTWIPYMLAEQSRVIIRIYDVAGQLIKTLDLGIKPAGGYLSKEKAAYWDGCGDDGQPVASGVYFYTLYAGSYQTTKKMTVIR